MGKKYFELIEDDNTRLSFEKEIIIAKEKDIIKEYGLNWCLYVFKDDYIKDRYNLKNYKLGLDISDTVDNRTYQNIFEVNLCDNESMFSFFCFAMDKISLSDISLDRIVEMFNDEMRKQEKNVELTLWEIKKFLDEIKDRKDNANLFEEVIYLWEEFEFQKKRIVVNGFYDCCEDAEDVTEEHRNFIQISSCQDEIGFDYFLKKNFVNNKIILICGLPCTGKPQCYSCYDINVNIKNIEEAIDYVKKKRTSFCSRVF